MPGTTKPNKPRPKQVTFTDGTFSWISCEDSVANGIQIFDWNGTSFIQTPNGTYNLQSGGAITVTGGIISIP